MKSARALAQWCLLTALKVGDLESSGPSCRREEREVLHWRIAEMLVLLILRVQQGTGNEEWVFTLNIQRL